MMYLTEHKEQNIMEDGYTTEGYYQACVNGTWVTFVSYKEYVEYIND